jgi:hypothetical protein
MFFNYCQYRDQNGAVPKVQTVLTLAISVECVNQGPLPARRRGKTAKE